jgi:hypothetical protein
MMHGGLSILAVLVGLLVIAWLFADEPAKDPTNSGKGSSS